MSSQPRAPDGDEHPPLARKAPIYHAPICHAAQAATASEEAVLQEERARPGRPVGAPRSQAGAGRSTGSTRAAELARPRSSWLPEARWTPGRSLTRIRQAAGAQGRLLAAVVPLRAARRALRR